MSPWDTVFGMLHGQAGTHKDQGRRHLEEERFHILIVFPSGEGAQLLGW